MHVNVTEDEPVSVNADRKVIQLSPDEEEELINCFTDSDKLDDEYEKIAISYIDRFIGNKMPYDLYFQLKESIIYYKRFQMMPMIIHGEYYMMFSINGYFRLIPVEDDNNMTMKKRLKLPLYIKTYEHRIVIDDYQCIYSIRKDWNIYGNAYSYIKFIIYKDDKVFSMNRYDYKKSIKFEIENTLHFTGGTKESKTKNYGFEPIGLNKDKLIDSFNAALVMNTLKDSDDQ